MKHLFALLVLAVFAAGIGVGSMIGLFMPSNDAIAFETYTASNRGLSFNPVTLAEPVVQEEEELKAVPKTPSAEGPVERDSPGDWIKESQIEMRPDGVFIRLNNPQWAILADTNSMDPVFDAEAHLIQTIPVSPEQIRVGDIVSYNSPMGFTIVHRVIEIGYDEEGWYAILKGDNNPTSDPWKVRWNMVTRVTDIIIY
ncbi:signal peptidase I [Candidatus Woesearchaeota archaeon]|nr:signal peptidase I [Candidatus Woesearchaeota archaeon]MBW3016399.1 signal peptidase I [Candidatus Woesearchaeota archaeon]